MIDNARLKMAMDALKAAPVCITRMTGDGGGYEVCRWVECRLVVMETAPTAGSADVLKDEIDRRAKAEAVIAALDAHDGAPVGWRPIESAVCDDRLALVEWKDGHLTVEVLDHDSDPTYWKRRGARQWCDISELVNRGIPPHTERSAVARAPADAVKAALSEWLGVPVGFNFTNAQQEAALKECMARALAAADAARAQPECEAVVLRSRVDKLEDELASARCESTSHHAYWRDEQDRRMAMMDRCDKAVARLAEIAEIVAVVRYGDWSQWSIARGLQRISDLATRPLDAPQVTPQDPATAPGHTDLMVPPETVDTFMRDNPLPTVPVTASYTREKDSALYMLLMVALEDATGLRKVSLKAHFDAAFEPITEDKGNTNVR